MGTYIIFNQPNGPEPNEPNEARSRNYRRQGGGTEGDESEWRFFVDDVGSIQVQQRCCVGRGDQQWIRVNCCE